tara:strand:- start:14841 stop:15656 length:816 start_codon:yes stop_codon:yes gene_type:complete
LEGLQSQHQEESPEQPQQQDQESSPELSELAPETVETTEQIESTSDDSSIALEAEQPVSDQGQEEQKIEFSSFDNVSIDSIPEESRPYVQPILDLASNYVSELQEEKNRFESARSEFHELMDSIRSSEDIKPLVSKLETQQTTIDEMTKDIVSTSWRAFNAAHPEIDNLPQNARDEFAGQLEHIYERFQGETLVDRMEDAYKYSLYRAGIKLDSLSAATIPEPKLEQKQPNPVATRQAVVADGHVAHGQPVRSVDEMEWGEVLGRYDYLLE